MDDSITPPPPPIGNDTVFFRSENMGIISSSYGRPDTWPEMLRVVEMCNFTFATRSLV